MSSIFSKLRDFVGLTDPADYEYEYDEMEGEEYQDLYQEENPQPQPTPVPSAEESRRSPRRIRERMMNTEPGMVMNNVIGMPGAINGMSEVVVMEPRSFEEMPQAIQALRERKSVVLNLTVMDPDQAQRAVDFVAGGTYAIDGHQERIGESIFLFTPNCVQVSTRLGAENDFIETQPQARPMPQHQPAPAPAWVSEQQARMA